MRNSLFPLCFRVAETGNPLIGWNCHVSVVFPERKCLVMFPLHFWVRIYVVVCFRYVSSHGFKQSFLSILNFIIKSQELFNKTKTCLPRGGNGKSTYWLELSCFRRNVSSCFRYISGCGFTLLSVSVTFPRTDSNNLF